MKIKHNKILCQGRIGNPKLHLDEDYSQETKPNSDDIKFCKDGLIPSVTNPQISFTKTISRSDMDKTPDTYCPFYHFCGLTNISTYCNDNYKDCKSYQITRKYKLESLLRFKR